MRERRRPGLMIPDWVHPKFTDMQFCFWPNSLLEYVSWFWGNIALKRSRGWRSYHHWSRAAQAELVKRALLK